MNAMVKRSIRDGESVVLGSGKRQRKYRGRSPQYAMVQSPEGVETLMKVSGGIPFVKVESSK